MAADAIAAVADVIAVLVAVAFVVAAAVAVTVVVLLLLPYWGAGGGVRVSIHEMYGGQAGWLLSCGLLRLLL